MAKKMMMILNPTSGKGGLRNHLQDILQLFHRCGWEVTVFPTHKAGDATEYAKNRYKDFDLVVCCGGDGTLNETITGLMQQPIQPKLGYIPVGTANDLAATLNLKKNPVAAAADIMKGREFFHDIGQFNDRYFSYICAMGTFSNISYSTPQSMKKTLGKAAYVIEAVKNISDIKPRHVKITIDGQTIEDDFAVCSIINSHSYAGLFKLKEDGLAFDDGIFEVLLIKHPKNPIEVSIIMEQLIHQNYDNKKYVYLHHGKDIQVHLEKDTPWCLDGEFGGNYRDISIKACERQMIFRAGK